MKATILHSEVHKDWGGEPIRVLEEAAGMTERGFKVVIAAQPDSELIRRSTAEGLLVEPIMMKKWLSYPHSLIHAIKILIRQKVDIVNTHASYDSWIFSIAAKLINKRLIRTRHISTRLKTAFSTKFIYRLPDLVFTTGEALREYLINLLDLDPERVLSVPSCPDVNRFNPERISAKRENFGIKQNNKVIGIVAALRDWKGHIYLLTAITELMRKKSDYSENIKLLIVGDGSEKVNITRKSKELGIERNVVMLGQRDDVPEMISLMDIFVLPSYAEGIPQALLQAMAMGLPVVSCPVGSIPEIFNQSGNTIKEHTITSSGFPVPPKDSVSLAKAMEHLLERPGLCKEMGKTNRALILEKYSRQSMLDRIEEAYRRLLKCE